jgi:hypothetical protein
MDTALHPSYPKWREYADLFNLASALNRAGMPEEDRLVYLRYAHAPVVDAARGRTVHDGPLAR